ncbi:MAG TPA: carboxypeptidase-like regulatory domain-containing protein, partial [Terriglobia bacterium]|nr:carboxypeptidase-like regulatory domain-containing protein [Terriglobia bacterium]
MNSSMGGAVNLTGVVHSAIIPETGDAMKNLLLIGVLLAPAVVAAQIPKGTVSGEIRNREGQPAAGVRVSAMAVPDAGFPANSGTALVSIGTTDNQGRYTLENVLPGRYYITAGFVDLPTYYPGVSAVSGATVVNVLSGTPVTGINFAVTNNLGVTVRGRVRRATGTGGVGGQPIAMIGGNRPIQQATTAADGSFQFQRVLPGTYQLTSPGAAGRPSQPVSVVVGDQDVTGLEIVVIPTATVTGNVVVEGNGMKPRVQLQLSPFKGTGQTSGMSTQPDGTFRANVPEGEYRVSWTNLPVGHELKSITTGSVDLLTTPLKVSVDTPPEPIKVLLAVDGNPWVKVSGRVINLGSNRTLVLTGPSVEQIQLTVNPDGTFQIPQALPGTYQIRPNTSALATPSLVMQLTSVVIPNQDTTNLVITLPPTKDVQGIVVNNSGAGVQVRLSVNYSQTNGGGLRTIGTQPDGRFTLEIPEGSDLRLTLSVPGYTVKSATYGTTDLMRENIRVTAKDTAELRVVLDTTSTTIAGGGVVGGVLGGIVTSAAAAPPPQPPPSPQAAPSSPASINRISEAVAKPNLLSSVPPAYPTLA